MKKARTVGGAACGYADFFFKSGYAPRTSKTAACYQTLAIMKQEEKQWQTSMNVVQNCS